MGDRNVGINLTGRDSGVALMFAKAGLAAETLDAKAFGLSKSMKALGTVFAGVELVKGLGEATKAAANFQTAVTRLKTDANESSQNLAMVSKGMLTMAGATGTTTLELAKGAYKVESAGFHGANALKVLQAAAE